MPTLWITRSQPGADRLASALETDDVTLLVQPLIEIEYREGWEKVNEELGTPQFVVVTSQHAAAQYINSTLSQTSSTCLHIALGEATASILRQAKLSVELPTHQSSEGVIELVADEVRPPDAVAWIVAGEGGREVLQDRLAKLGIRAVKFETYRRVAKEIEKLTQLPELIEIASRECLKLAVQSLPRVDRSVFVVASERLRLAAENLQVAQIELAAGADVSLMKAAVLNAAQQSERKQYD